nr:DUF3302 domain-containing protein [Methylobacterium frigidaeris]
MPGRIARRRGHPWAQAVAVGSLATLICGFVFSRGDATASSPSACGA